MGSKAPEAFRTISEVSEILETPPHVLRFWESKFTQVKPVKRAGGRRYYRPSDLELLAGIKQLLHEDGMTIRGVQKLLREQGVKHVAGLGTLPAEHGGGSAEGAEMADDNRGDTPAAASAPQPQPYAQPEPPATEPPATTPPAPDDHSPAADAAPGAAARQQDAGESPREGAARPDTAAIPTAEGTPRTRAPAAPPPDGETGAPFPSAASAHPAAPVGPAREAADAVSDPASGPLPASRLRMMRPLPAGPRREALGTTLERLRRLHARLAQASAPITD